MLATKRKNHNTNFYKQIPARKQKFPKPILILKSYFNWHLKKHLYLPI